MGDLFRIGPGDERKDQGIYERCCDFARRHCHPLQVGTGLLFSTVGIGMVAAGHLYADGIGFALQTVGYLPQGIADVAGGGNLTESIDYARESYRSSMEGAIGMGWKQAPLSYCIGHYLGGRLRRFVSDPFGRRGD